MSNTKTIPKQTLAGVFTTKRGLHEFLTVEMEYYLPPNEYTNIEWLREVWAGGKKVSQN
jgi:hypothetical protein